MRTHTRRKRDEASSPRAKEMTCSYSHPRRASCNVLLSSTEIDADATTMAFALDGANNEINLAPAAAKELRDALAPFIGAARKVRRTSRGRRACSLTSAPTAEQSAARAWLLEQGVDVPSRGHLSAELLERHRPRQGSGKNYLICRIPT